MKIIGGSNAAHLSRFRLAGNLFPVSGLRLETTRSKKSNQMKKIVLSGVVAGAVLFVLSILGLFATLWLFPGVAMQYFDPAFRDQSSRYLLFFAHPFLIAQALSWFWSRFKQTLTGPFLTRGIEFGLIYAGIATLPSMWMIYSTISVSLAMTGTWFLFGLLQGIVSGLIFEKMNP